MPAIRRKSTGSSPLTRGKLDRPESPRPGSRLIPAHAGKTERRRRDSIPHPAHPRSRGENLIVDRPANPQAGSSPLTRGKQHTEGADDVARRLIPAHAGKTPAVADVPSHVRAHPRSRGENRWLHCRHVTRAGSSPLTRGKHFLTCAFIAQIDQILESLELCAFSESYSSQDVYATDAPRDRVRSIGLAPRSSRGAS